MQTKTYLMLIFAAMLSAAGCTRSDFPGVEELVERRVPWLADRVELREIENGGGGESFTLKAEGGKLIVEATSANTAAVGVNRYLEEYCHRSMSHMGDNLSPVDSLPLPESPLTVSTTSEYRYALNYCTFNYSMSFYTWEDWERELDWMALNGVNMMLVANGSEAVWQNTLQRLGYSEDEIGEFISGPAYNAWWLMGNLEGWGGPMPRTQIDSRAETVQKMLARMGELGIEPLMPGFYGMIPSSYKERSGARIITQGMWQPFTRPDILDPTDPEFDRIASIFYEETKKLYGEDIRFFSGDPFHEGGSVAGVDLGEAGRAIQDAMQRHFPGSVWVLQGWQDNPKPALLEKLDRRYVLVQELFGENTANWEARDGYEGTPFIWATVTNFGERPGLYGKLQRMADEVHRASENDYMKGVGILPEGIYNNPVVWDLMLELPWHSERVDVSKWIGGYIASRYGRHDERLVEAWRIFLETVYASDFGYQEGPPENILCARPGFEVTSVSTWGRIAKKYDTGKFADGVRLFASAHADFKDSETYRIDLVDMLRQTIADRADGVFTKLMAAYDKKDKATFDECALEFLSLHDTGNRLLATEPFFRVDTYQRQALESGNTLAEKDNNLLCAMMLVTYWGGSDTAQDYLHDYAYKEWSGMMDKFYKKRWELWFDYLRRTLDGHVSEKPNYYFWEREWVENNRKLISETPAAPLDDNFINSIF
jgi:alpha-N-acetylglucosaminidase